MISKPLSKLSKKITSGLTPLRSNPEFWTNGTIPWLKTEQLGEKYIYDTNEKITQNALDKTSIKICPPNTLTVAMYGEGRTRGNLSIIKNEMATNQACCNIELDNKVADHEYVYYFLKTQYEELRNLSSGVRKNLNSNDIKNFNIRLPENLKDQQKIASVLSSLDAKIELNNRINSELEVMAKTLYDYWFLQFDFPDKSGKPYKSTGGKMVYNEELKREIPESWITCKLEDVIEIHDSKRIPLSKQTRERRQGIYPYYGATSVMDFIDDYIFDGILVLLAEDGSVMDKNGNPVLQYIWGKSWVNNHAHVLEAKNGFTNEYLHMMLKNIPVIHIMSGSIQKKINQENLRNTKIMHPGSLLLNSFQKFIKPIYEEHIILTTQTQQLTQLRDWLLPMLMNGQVRVV